ncbi:MAG: hypothetical protein ACRDU9_04060 [Acidimicrobiia bacterium]
MRPLPRRVASLGALAVMAACGQVEPVLMPVSMPECIYQGVSSMEEGSARLSLTLNGLGEAGVALVRLTGEKTYDDLVEHLGSVSGAWDRRPDWVTTEIELRLDASQGLVGVEETRTLDEGAYAIVCIAYPYDGADAEVSPASALEVSGD